MQQPGGKSHNASLLVFPFIFGRIETSALSSSRRVFSKRAVTSNCPLRYHCKHLSPIRYNTSTIIMDIVLEVADTFLFVHIYSTILPSYPLARANATLSSITHEPTGFVLPAITWQYEPVSKCFSLQPSQAAYESAWPRDDWRRQLLTLYLITWYCQKHSPNMNT